ncbi:hypothetical protein BJF78_31760 [Pseudonocardia sp. CNS-139]|nr:hypothetical protein BJF78_31760 [Pseudonocardia sp. CNS-139]
MVIRAAGVLAAAFVAGCAAGCTAAAPDPVDPPLPPAPPAACVLDTAALGTATGLVWTPDASTASDTRCVYDPATAAAPDGGPAFVTVDLAPAQGPDPATELDSVAALCDAGSRARSPRATAGSSAGSRAGACSRPWCAAVRC